MKEQNEASEQKDQDSGAKPHAGVRHRRGQGDAPGRQGAWTEGMGNAGGLRPRFDNDCLLHSRGERSGKAQVKDCQHGLIGLHGR